MTKKCSPTLSLLERAPCCLMLSQQLRWQIHFLQDCRSEYPGSPLPESSVMLLNTPCKYGLLRHYSVWVINHPVSFPHFIFEIRQSQHQLCDATHFELKHWCICYEVILFIFLTIRFSWRYIFTVRVYEAIINKNISMPLYTCKDTSFYYVLGHMEINGLICHSISDFMHWL